jgi:hypothetical protein
MVYPGAGIANSTGSAWGTSYGTTGVNSVMLRDANQNTDINNIDFGYSTFATAAGTTTLTVASPYYIYFTGATTQTLVMPVTSTLALGWSYHIANNSTGNITVNSSGANLIGTILPGTTIHITCIDTAVTTAAGWDYGFTDFSTATGTGSVVLSSSPTITGTIGLSGTNLSAAAWTTAGIAIKQAATTYTDTSSTGTVADVRINNFAAQTLAASSTTTVTSFYGTYFTNPVAGTNVTATLTYAVGMDSLSVVGNASIGGTTSTLGFGSAISSGIITIGGASGTGSITLGRSTLSQTTNIQAAATASGSTKTINLGTAGLSGSTTAISIGSAVSGATTTLTLNGTVTSSSLADAVGYKGLPPSAQTQGSAITLALTDMGKIVPNTLGGWVIPANGSVAFPVGSTVIVYNDSAANQTISITTDTMYLAGTATTGSRTLAQRGLATLVKVASTTWVASGAGVT